MTEHWGRPLWYLIHTITYNYSKKPSEYEKYVYYKFFSYIPDLILCTYCKRHYYKFISRLDIKLHINKKTDLINYFISLHNSINLRLKKKIISRTEANSLYKNCNTEYILKYIKTIFFMNKNKYKQFIKLLILVFPNKHLSSKLISYNIFKLIDDKKIRSDDFIESIVDTINNMN